MTVKIKTFASLRDILPSEFSLPIAENTTVGTLLERICADRPDVESLVRASITAIDEERVEKDHRLVGNETVYLLPPYSGG